MSTDPVFSEIQKINPSAIIELFVLQLDSTLHGTNVSPTGESNIFRFHAGSNLNANGQIRWQAKSYLRYPVSAEGFAFQRGQLPRPKFIVSNALGLMSGLLHEVNLVTPGNDLTGASVTRIRTMVRFIDADNFAPINNNPPVNPFGTPDSTAEFPREIYYIDRKSIENREVVEFELAAVFDLAGVRAPKRQCTRTLFPSIGTFN